MEDGLPIGLDSLYNVVTAPDTWPTVLHDLARSVNAVGACIAADHGSSTLIAHPVSPDLTLPIEDFINNGWYQRDLRGVRAWPLLKRGRKLLVEHDISTDEERKRSAYHNEWLRPWDLPWWSAVGFSFDDRTCGLVVLRSSGHGALTYEEMQPLTGLRPHLTRILDLIRILADQRAEAVLDALHLIEQPAFLLAANGHVSRLNPEAENLLKTDLALTHGILKARWSDNDKGLQRLIAATQSPRFPSDSPDEGPVVIRRLGNQPLIVRALPVIGALSDVLGGARAILLVTDLEAKRLPSSQALRVIFNLTPTETRIAIHLAAGLDLAAIAEETAISLGTIRNHLKAIFAKTDTHRQSELALLLQRIGTP